MEFDHWSAAVRRRAWLVLGIIAGCLALSVVLTIVQTPVYRATAEVRLAQPTAAALLGTTATAPDLETELKLARGSAVTKAAGRTPADASVTVSIDGASGTLRFDGSAASAEGAAAIANAYAKAYVEVRQERADEAYEESLETLRREIAAIDAKLRALRGSSAATQQTRENLQAQRDAYQAALDRVAVASIVGGTSGAQVLTEAEAPTRPASPRLVPYLAFGLLAGLFLAAGAVGVAEFLDRSVRGPGSASRAASGAAVLGNVASPRSGGADADAGGTGVVVIDAPASAAAERYRALRTTVLASTDAERRILQVAGSAADDGASDVAVNLAVALARAGERTVLVCLAPLAGVQVGLAAPKDPTPLRSFVRGPADPQNVMARVKGVDGLWAVPWAEVPGLADNFARRTVADNLRSMLEAASTIVVLSPPLLGSAVAIEAAASVDATIISVRDRSTRLDDVSEAQRALGLVDARLLGLVLA